MHMPPRLVPALALTLFVSLPSSARAQAVIHEYMPDPSMFLATALPTVLEDTGGILGGSLMGLLYRFGLVGLEDLPGYRRQLEGWQDENSAGEGMTEGGRPAGPDALGGPGRFPGDKKGAAKE